MRVHSLGQEDPLEESIATTPVFLPGESYGQRTLVSYSPWGHKVGHDWRKIWHTHISECVQNSDPVLCTHWLHLLPISDTGLNWVSLSPQFLFFSPETNWPPPTGECSSWSYSQIFCRNYHPSSLLRLLSEVWTNLGKQCLLSYFSHVQLCATP